MLPKIQVRIECQSNQAFMLDIIYEMKMSELSEFIMNSHILHWSSKLNKTLKPLSLKSNNRSLLIDYLLNSSFTIGEVYQVYQYSKVKENIQHSYLKEKEFFNNQKEEIMPIVVQYDSESQSQEKQGVQCCYTRQGPEFLMDKSCQKEGIIFYDSINWNESQLVLVKSVPKWSLNSYQQVNKVLFIKKRLIQLDKQLPLTFQQLLQVTEDEQKINFCFSYLPSVSFSQLLHLQFSISAIDNFTNKIWILLLRLKRLKLQGYLYRLYKSKSLKVLFDKLRVCIDNRIIIDDLSLLFQQESNQTFNESERKDLISQIKIYLKVNKSHTDKYQNFLQVEGRDYFNKIYLFTFSKLFLLQKYSFHSFYKDNYQSRTDCFTWKKGYSALKHNLSSINEATTAKKPRQAESKNKNKEKVNYSTAKVSEGKKQVRKIRV